MFNLRHGIYLIIFSMPLYFWRFSILGIPVNFLELMIYVLFLLWVLKNIRNPVTKKEVFLWIHSYKKYYFSKEYSLLNIGIILLFFGLMASTALSSDLRTSLGIFKGWFVSPVLFFVIFIDIIKKKEHILDALKSWLASGVVVALISLFYLLIGDMTFDGRLKAFFLSPNHLAMYLAPVFLIVCSFLLNNEKEKRLFNIIVLIVVAVPLYFTYSYGALLGIFFGLIYLIIKNRGLKTRNIYLYAFIIVLFSGFIYLSSNKFNQISNSENRSSFHSRAMIWNTSREIIKNNPLLGIGPGTFQEIYLSYANKFSEPYLEWAVPQPHNIFLAFYLQTGLVGFTGFILILIWFFSRRNIVLLRLGDTDTINRASTIVYVINALMLYILVHGLVDTTYWKNDLALMFWIIIGLKFISIKQNCFQNREKLFADKSIDKNIN